MLIDTHSHIHSADYPLDRVETIARAASSGVEKIICVATSKEDERLAKKLADAYPGTIFYRGYERGLDYHYDQSAGQKSELIEYIRANVDKPLIFHVREAFPDFIDVLSEFPNVRGVAHSYSGSPEDTARLLAFPNLFFGISGLAIFKDLELPPLTRLVLETDSPYLAPPPFRGKTNEPMNINLIAEWVADKFGITVDEVAQATTKNAETLFNI